jgi:hypothetical protein
MHARSFYSLRLDSYIEIQGPTRDSVQIKPYAIVYYWLGVANDVFNSIWGVQSRRSVTLRVVRYGAVPSGHLVL